MNTLTLSITPLRSALLADHDNTVDALVRVVAPAAPAGDAPPRAPLNLALVLDRSGSMQGRPLEEAKRCAEFVVNSLGAEDRVAVIAYDKNTEVLALPMPASERVRLVEAIRSIQVGGMTDLHNGWLCGAAMLAPLAAPNVLSRVILLSDGCANRGITSLLEIAERCDELAGAGVTTSTYGLGRNFNEDLMVAMAAGGQGNSYFGQTAEDLMDPFREELSLLSALCARSLELQVAGPDGTRIDLLNVYVRGLNGGWQLPDLAYDSEAWAVVRLRVPSSFVAELAAGGTLLEASLRYSDLAGEPRAVQPVALSLPAVPAQAFAAIAEDPVVRRRVTELEVAKLQTKARHAARRGDWKTTERVLERMVEIAGDNQWVKSVIEELRALARRRDQQMFGKEATYSSRRMSTRLAARDEDQAGFSGTAPDYLRRKSAQGKAAPQRPG